MKVKVVLIPSKGGKHQQTVKQIFEQMGKLGKAKDIPQVEYVIIDDELCDIAGRKCGRLK